MIIALLFLAPLIAADGTNIGRAYDECTARAAVAHLWTDTAENLADRSIQVCRALEPKLREGMDRMWRTNRDGTVAPPSNVSRIMTAEGWDRLVKARRNRLVSDITQLRMQLKKK